MIKKKMFSILKNGIQPITVGMYNHKNLNNLIERKARVRAMECVKCENFVDEPISFFKVEDKRITELSGKSCKDCGCVLPYLLRQNVKICKNWRN